MGQKAIEEAQERWLSGHLYYHQSLNPVIHSFVYPLVVSLIEDRLIDAFFFVRYALGGPHVRLRLRVIPGTRQRALEVMQWSARRFLDLEPSTRPLKEEEIRQANASILAADPHETDASIYPDNFFRLAPFRPEVQRYGGPSRLQASLDFFTLSSAATIELSSRDRAISRSAQLAHALRLLLRQAIGFADDEAELLALVSYAVNWWGEMLPRVCEKADIVARSQREDFLHLLHHSLTGVRSLQTGRASSGLLSDLLVAGAGRLSAVLATVDRNSRARIGCSQLHMTASRLGLSNAEEVYLSRLLTLTLEEVRADSKEDLSWIGKRMTRGATESQAEALSNLIPAALATLVEGSSQHRLGG